MKLKLISAIAIAAAAISCTGSRDIISENVENAKIQLKSLVEASEAGDTVRIPSTFKNGEIDFVPEDDWVSGFFAGSLWYMYELTGDEYWADHARIHTEKLDTIQNLKWHHDIGFMIYDSYGNGLRLKNIEGYEDVIVNAARSLSTRFRPGAGVIQSWDIRGWQATRGWKCPVIIDNMMNLELLMSVGDMFNNDTLRTIAKTHADTTIKNHFRPDYTSFHVVDYNPETGEVNMKCTHQGYSDESAWARGQAWGLYGYTMMYAFSGEERYLAQAENIAKALIPRLPEDGIPFWDFDAPNGEEHRDTSAGAIMASALVQLSTLTKDAEASKCYLATAEKQMRSMATPKYLAEPGTNCSFLLRRSVGHFKGNSEIDVPLTYADYYYLEALLRYRALNK